MRIYICNNTKVIKTFGKKISKLRCELTTAGLRVKLALRSILEGLE
jgi:hypothetical protein